MCGLKCGALLGHAGRGFEQGVTAGGQELGGEHHGPCFTLDQTQSGSQLILAHAPQSK